MNGKRDKRLLVIILTFVLVLYHYRVVSAVSMQQGNQCRKYKDISKGEYDECKKGITYLSTFFKFNEVLFPQY